MTALDLETQKTKLCYREATISSSDIEALRLLLRLVGRGHRASQWLPPTINPQNFRRGQAFEDDPDMPSQIDM